MKKVMFGLAAAAAISAFAAIESANTVGYHTQDWMNQGDYYMMGGQFETTAGADVKLSEIDFGINLENVPTADRQGRFRTTAPQVQIAFADREGYTAYYFAKTTTALNGTWVTAGGAASDPTIGAGIGFWYRDQSATQPSFTFAGQVVPDSPWEKTFDANYRMLVCPFPKAVTLAEIDFEDIAVDAPAADRQGRFKATATQIQVPFADREGFTTYYFATTTTKPEGTWVTAGGAVANAAEITIPAGRGCWFKPAKEMTVTFTK